MAANDRAYYKAAVGKADNEFWITVHGNFIDACVLEWLKLFGNSSENHHWKTVVEDPDSFREEMLEACDITLEEFTSCWKSFKSYRDDFVAHLGSERTMHIPRLDIALAVTYYYYGYISEEGLHHPHHSPLPENLESYYLECITDSEKHFGG